MRKQPHRDHAPGFYGQVHARGRMRHAAIAIACTMLAFPATAVAEVCDKVVGQGWRRSHGPLWTVTVPGFFDWAMVPFTTWVIVLGVPCALALATISGRISLLAAIVLKWVGYVVAGFVVFVALSAVHMMVFLDGIDAIHAIAGLEGCIVFHHDWRAVLFNMGVIGLLVLVYVGMAFRMRRFERGIEARQRRLLAS